MITVRTYRQFIAGKSYFEAHYEMRTDYKLFGLLLIYRKAVKLER